MPFTLEEVEKALTSNHVIPNFPPELVPQLNAGRQQVTDYLTGKTASLQGLQIEAFRFYLPGLLTLLGPLDPPSANDQLVLDIFLHPNVWPFIDLHVLSHLTVLCFQQDTPSIIQTALTILGKNGVGRQELFQNMLRYLENISYEEWEAIPPASGVKKFLVANIPANLDALLQNVFGSGISFYYRQSFDKSTFYLLEEHRPHWLPDFIDNILIRDSAGGIFKFIIEHKQGVHLPILEELLQRPSNREGAHSKRLELAAHFFFLDRSKYQAPILAAVGSYLDYWKQEVLKAYDHHITIEELKDQGLGYYRRRSTVCWFLILQYDPSQALAQAARWYTEKLPLHEDTLVVFYQYTGKNALSLLLSATALESGDMEPRKMAITLLTQHFDWSDYGQALRALMNHKSKPMRDLIARTLVEIDPEAETLAISLLQHKRSEIRQSAATILNLIASPTAKTAMTEALDKESNDNARDILLETLADSLPGQGDKAYVDTIIAAADARGKLSKPSSILPDEDTLPDLFYTTGEKLDTPAIRFLLYRMSRCKGFNSDIEARYLIRLIDKTKSAPFATILLKTFLDRQAPPEEKYLMLLAALLGNEDTAAAIRRLVDDWINASRLKMAEYGIGALAIQGSDKALRWVEWYSRKYAVKKANVGAAATAALEAAATELGITTYELGDRVVPDFGFDGLFRHFEAGGDSYRAFIDSKFKLAFFDENDKKLKAIPASAPEELKQEFKAITKEIRDIVKSQSPRLEYYLIIQRRWNLAQWQKFFLNNPVMFIYATRLLWGVYKDEAETPDITFLCDEDTTLLDLNEEELTPQPEWSIGIVHPSQLDPSYLRAWQEKFFDKGIEAVFPQLDRRQADLEDLDLSKTIIRKFDGRKTQTGSIRSTLDRQGWRPGPTGDGGMIGTYHLLNDAKKIEAILEIEGVGAGFGWTGNEKIGRLYFARKPDTRKKWWHYPKDDADPLLVPLKEIPTLFLHETLAAIDTIKPAPAT